MQARYRASWPAAILSPTSTDWAVVIAAHIFRPRRPRWAVTAATYHGAAITASHAHRPGVDAAVRPAGNNGEAVAAAEDAFVGGFGGEAGVGEVA